MTTTRCKDCKHFREHSLFNECNHEKAKYKLSMANINREETAQHTVTHMRLNACGSEARLFEKA